MNKTTNFVLYFTILSCIFHKKCYALCDQPENLDLDKMKESLISDRNIAVSCKDQLFDYLNGLKAKSKWALNMLYSGSVPVPTSNSLGFFDDCIAVRANFNSITGQYCLVSVAPKKSNYDNVFSKPSTPDSSTQLATCVPNACQANDTEKFLSLLGLNVTVDESLCQTKGPNFKFTPIVIAATIIFSGIFLSILWCTIYEICNGAKGLLSGSLIENLSLRTNFNKLVTGGKANQLLCLHGIRAICILGVIFYHVQNNQSDVAVANSWYIPKWSTTIFGAVILNWPRPAILTFFLMSGFLIAYTYMKLLERNQQLNIIKYYLRRYFRLTPVLAVVILFYVSYLQYVGSGPFWPSQITQKQVVMCDTQWWMALLYIQDLTLSVNYCINVSWYITIDIQLYILSPLLLYVIRKRPQDLLRVCTILLMGSFLYSIFVVLYFKPSIIPDKQNPESLAATYIWFKDSVIICSAPWLIGIALGYLVTMNQKKKMVIAKIWSILLWTFFIGVIIVSTVVDSIVVSNPTDHAVLQALYLIIYPLFWPIGIAWVIFACLFNYAGSINSFLSWPIFQVISKLSYSMYLLHEVINYIIVSQYRYPIIFGSFEILSLYCITLVLTMFFATLMVLFVEWPAMAISEYFFKRQAMKSGILLSAKSYTEETSNT